MVGSTQRPETELELDISDAVSRLYLDTFGKGPLHVVTVVAGDLVTSVAREVLTVAEHALIAGGRSDSVLTTRMLWQHATDATFKAAIEEATGRRVLTVISGFELDDDVGTEVFLLAPQ